MSVYENQRLLSYFLILSASYFAIIILKYFSVFNGFIKGNEIIVAILFFISLMAVIFYPSTYKKYIAIWQNKHRRSKLLAAIIISVALLGIKAYFLIIRSPVPIKPISANKTFIYLFSAFGEEVLTKGILLLLLNAWIINKNKNADSESRITRFTFWQFLLLALTINAIFILAHMPSMMTIPALFFNGTILFILYYLFPSIILTTIFHFFTNFISATALNAFLQSLNLAPLVV